MVCILIHLNGIRLHLYSILLFNTNYICKIELSGIVYTFFSNTMKIIHWKILLSMTFRNVSSIYCGILQAQYKSGDTSNKNMFDHKTWLIPYWAILMLVVFCSTKNTNDILVINIIIVLYLFRVVLPNYNPSFLMIRTQTTKQQFRYKPAVNQSSLGIWYFTLIA